MGVERGSLCFRLAHDHSSGCLRVILVLKIHSTKWKSKQKWATTERIKKKIKEKMELSTPNRGTGLDHVEHGKPVAVLCSSVQRRPLLLWDLKIYVSVARDQK